jgi:hypothetical protein
MARRRRRRAVGEACALVYAVAETGLAERAGRYAPWTSAPIADGGLQVEWRGLSARIEVQVAPDGSVGYLIQRGEGRSAVYEEAEDVPFDDLVEAIVGV